MKLGSQPPLEPFLANSQNCAVAALLARRENPIYEDVRSDVGLGMFFGPPMNPPDIKRRFRKPDRWHRDRRSERLDLGNNSAE
jgi:hypothetical protein